MSTVTIHVPEEKKAGLINLLRDIPYIIIESDQPSGETSEAWRSLQGKYAQSGITTETLSRENEMDKAYR